MRIFWHNYIPVLNKFRATGSKIDLNTVWSLRAKKAKLFFSMTDHELISGCINRDRKFQKSLYEKYSGIMYAICLRYCHDRDQALDILQDGFIKVFNKVHTYQSQGSFEGWMKKYSFTLQSITIIKSGTFQKICYFMMKFQIPILINMILFQN